MADVTLYCDDPNCATCNAAREYDENYYEGYEEEES